MSVYELCFSNPPENSFVEFSLGGVLPENRIWIPTSEAETTFKENKDKNTCYFGPAVRKKKGMDKDAVLASQVVWADIDKTDEAPKTVFPPTLILSSGHGFHYYWKLKEWFFELDKLEAVISALGKSIGGDSVQNCNRLMRMPETFNVKQEPVRTEVVSYIPDRVYDIKEVYYACFLDDRIKRKILTGSTGGYKSRSERDWDIIRELIEIGLSDEAIYHIYDWHACGNKYNEPNGPRYLERTIEKLRKGDTSAVPFERPRPSREQPEGFFIEKGDGYYTQTKSGLKRLSTFIFVPKKILSSREGYDSFLVDVMTEFNVHKEHVLSKGDFEGTRSLSSSLPWADCSWFGRDSDVRELQAHLNYKVQHNGVPKSEAVEVLGRHQYSGKKVFVARNGVIAEDGQFWDSKEAPIVYQETGREAPFVEFRDEIPDEDFFLGLAETLPKMNLSSVLWPIFGWFAATALKKEYEDLGYRFPVLNVFGTRGSGKSTTLLKVFQPLFGYVEERSYDANTTRFVILSLLASTNACPVTFSEFRATTASNFTRFVLLSYDTGHDPRGRADQTTQDYALMAPFAVDGEDMLSDAAAMERIIPVQLSPATIKEHSEAWHALKKLTEMDLQLFFRPFIEYTMKLDLASLVETAERNIFDTFPMNVASRIRKNFILCWSGILVLKQFFRSQGVDFAPDTALVLKDSLFYVFRQALGRSPTAADEFVEYVINQAASGARDFPWQLNQRRLWFQLTPAYQSWVRELSRERKDHLSRQAIRDQLSELKEDYMGARGTKTIDHKTLWCYPVDLEKAFECGLDVPETFNPRKLVVNI